MTETDQHYIFGPFAFSISEALAIISATPDRKVHQLDVAQAARMMGVDRSTEEVRAGGTIRLMTGDVDEEYALTQADISVPVILGDPRLTDTGEPMTMFLDGTHRLRRAYVEGVAKLPAYVLTWEETCSIRHNR